jgi:ATP-dependent DNA ligase
MLQYRYPDDPIRITTENLRTMAPKLWLAQKKSDGWRCPAYRSDGKWTYYSKDGSRLAMPPDSLRAEFEALSWPDGIAVDMEWMGPRRAGFVTGHSFRIFDILYLDGTWLGTTEFQDRHAKLAKAFAKAAKGKPHPNVAIVPIVQGDLLAAFEKEKSDPLSEGLVIRMSSSGLVGSPKSKTKNPFWRKLKYRDVHEHASII